MSERVDKFCNDLRDHLNAVEARLNRVKTSVDSAAAKTQADIDAKKKEVEAAYKAEQQKLEDAKAKAKSWIETIMPQINSSGYHAIRMFCRNSTAATNSPGVW